MTIDTDRVRARLCGEVLAMAAEIDRLRDALRTIRDAHAEPDQPGASCREGCGGRWPCLAWAEANAALNP